MLDIKEVEYSELKRLMTGLSKAWEACKQTHTAVGCALGEAARHYSDLEIYTAGDGWNGSVFGRPFRITREEALFDKELRCVYVVHGEDRSGSPIVLGEFSVSNNDILYRADGVPLKTDSIHEAVAINVISAIVLAVLTPGASPA